MSAEPDAPAAPPKVVKIPTSFRLSEQAVQLMKALDSHLGGIGRAAVVELALRDLAKARGVE